MTVERNIVEAQLNKFGNFNKWLTCPECAHLHEAIEPAEEIKAMSGGYFEGQSWLIVVTGRRLLFLKNTFSNELQQSQLLLPEIKEVTYSAGFRYGQLDFKTISGEKKIDMIDKKDVLLLSRMISEQLANYR